MNEKCLIGPGDIVSRAVEILETDWRKLVVVVDREQKVIGTITDGDLRRFFLAKGSLDGVVSEVMNRSPFLIAQTTTTEDAIKAIKARNLECAPSVSPNNRFQKLIHIDNPLGELAADKKQTLPIASAVIMAGGEGRRLRPITQSVPKPLVEVASKPIIVHQIERLVFAGIKDIFISVNYLADQIKETIGTGEQFGADVKYLTETKKLGTGGALSLAAGALSGATIVMNGDILTDLNCLNLGHFHQSNKADISVAVKTYGITIPFGVMELSGESVVSIDEKPTKTFFCNAGIYVIEPKVPEQVPKDQYFDMPQLIDLVLRKKGRVVAFPIHEYWSDIGTLEELSKARIEYTGNV